MASLQLKNKSILLLTFIMICTPTFGNAVSFSVSPIRYEVCSNEFSQPEAGGYNSFRQEEIIVEGLDETTPTVYFTFSGSGNYNADTTFFTNTLGHSQIKNEPNMGFEHYAILNGNKIYYKLLSRPRMDAVIKDVGTPLLEDNFLNGSAVGPLSQKTTVPFFFRITPGQSLQPGVYEDTIRVSMFDTSPIDSITKAPLRCALLKVKIVVPTMMSIAVSDDSISWKAHDFILGMPKYLEIFSDCNVTINAKIGSDDLLNNPFHVESQTINGNQFRIKIVPNSDRNPVSKELKQFDPTKLNSQYIIQIRNMD